MLRPPAKPVIDPALKQWATVRQAEVIDATNETGSGRAAARLLKVHYNAVQGALRAVKKKAALDGYAPEHDMTHRTAPGFTVKGTSTLYDKDGLTKLQWVKTRQSDEALEDALREFVDWLVQDAKGLSPIYPTPKGAEPETLSVLAFGDPHLGMRALADEAGEDFDLAEAVRLTEAAVDRMVTVAPNSGEALIINVGDLTHADDETARTPAHKNELDVSNKHSEVLVAAFKMFVYIAGRALQKFPRVTLWMLPGNHDPQTAFALALALQAYFDKEPRISIPLSRNRYRYHRFGKVLIGGHHGDGAKMADLPLIMATDRREDWGATEHKYWWTGHVHHDSKRDIQGVVVESLRTLAPLDAYAAGKGYRGGRDAKLIVYHSEFGEIERHRVDAAMLARRAA